MLPRKLAFVDIETTGTRAFYDRIIEIGILRVEDNEIVDTFQTLINPEGMIPREITMMTGISSEMLEDAPTFRQKKDDILEMLADCVFVAHNVRFDYGFLKNEFDREEITFTSKHFCTVQLSRMLYPQFRHHNLDSLIERYGFAAERRHRAYDDARVLVDFYHKVLKEFPPDHIEKIVSRALKKPTIPVNLKTDTSKLPEKPGVYIFYGADDRREEPACERSETGVDLVGKLPLYIGKSINIKQRVLSHFSSDIRSPIEMKISQQIESIEVIETAGELGALLLESKLIKEMLPLYNKKERIKRELTVLVKESEEGGYDQVKIKNFTKAEIESGFDDIRMDTILGFFKSKKQAKTFLIKTVNEYGLCEKLTGLEKATSGKNSECFAHRLGKCKGACIGAEKPLFYNLRFLMAFSSTKSKRWPFPGPIVITEAEGRKKDCFVIDRWRYFGQKKFDAEGNGNDLLNKEAAFDLDVYNIVKQYLAKPQNNKNIKIINPYIK